VPLHRPDKARLILDLETYSEVELGPAGAHAYAMHPSTGVHCVAWEIKGGFRPGRGLWLPGQPMPDKIAQHATAGDLVVAHNFMFELCIWAYVLARPEYGWGPAPALTSWSCTMARALYFGLPAALGLLSEALDLDNPKDPGARRNMLKLAKPRARSPTTWWKDDPVRGPTMLAELYAYCEQDVRAESEADDKLPELPAFEREVFLMDARANLRGIQVDLPTVDALQLVSDEERRRLDQLMVLATKGAVKSTTQTAALMGWLAQFNLPITSLAKNVMPAAIEAAVGTTAHFALRVRAEAAKSSTAKLAAMRAAVSPDGRARGLFQYYGAGRTGRWAGRRVQPQNMPRPHLKPDEIEHVLRLVHAGHGPADLEVLFPGTPMEVVSSCLRACLVPAPGKVFISVDLAQIEARVIAWLAGQQDILLVFARGEDVYTYTAGKIGSDNRQLGKVLVLACGFGMGGPKFAATATAYGLPMDEDAARVLVREWREASPAIVGFWRELGRVWADIAMAPNGTWERVGPHLMIGKTGKAVRVRLPSGRELVYQFAEVSADPVTGWPELSYMGVHQLTNRWTRLRTYGGKLAENVTQAVARDVMAEALLTLHRRPAFEVVGSFHDEGLSEVDEKEAPARTAESLAVFRTVPKWAPGLPIGAEGWAGARYRKG
jgi:DNA polymerase